MGLLPRTRDGSGLFYAVLGCAVTSLYFIFINDLKSTSSGVNVDYGNLSRMNYEYKEVCREWKQAIDQDKVQSTKRTPTKYKETKLDLTGGDGWEENSELSSQFHCDNSYKEKHISRRGQYYVIYNFVRAERDFGCIESITLSAPGDYRFLDNVIPLVDRWRGPISLGLYAPGYDFYTTNKAIAYLRNCETELIRKLVTFHIIFEPEHVPEQLNGTTILNSYEDVYDCSLPPPWEIVNDEDMYKMRNGLLYPINVARNVAKLAAKTYFVFPSDIELYPTRNFIRLFLDFAKDNTDLFGAESKNVFVLPIFEILENQIVPENKTQLLDMLNKKTAIIFHQRVCIVCHRVVESEKWVKAKETEGLGVFSVGKRTGRYMVWEPFFVCTQKEPLWDERMTWEGQNNKMVQAYTMCIMDYDFHVLDNAFLIHKPGVKKKKVQMEKFKDVVTKSTKVIRKIAIELQNLYGYNANCSTFYKSVLKKPKVSVEKEAVKNVAKIAPKKT